MMNWIPLMDYAVQKGISLSTLRRHIKANKVTYRVEGGKYLLLLDDEKRSQPSIDLYDRLEKLEIELAKTKEEISELKMLLALYEERLR